MNSYPELHEIIDLPRILDDDIIPNDTSHIVYINNPDDTGSTEIIPIIIPGFQWDYMWWIFRLMGDDVDVATEFTFPRFLNEYLGEVYKNYKNKN